MREGSSMSAFRWQQRRSRVEMQRRLPLLVLRSFIQRRCVDHRQSCIIRTSHTRVHE